MHLPASVRAWGTDDFPAAFKRELAEHTDKLPLRQALTSSSAVVDEPVTIVLLDVQADDALLRVKAGVFFSGIVAGCSCADDPTPVEPQTEYCELLLTIDRLTAGTTVSLLD